MAIKYSTINSFKGYRRREDKTNMPAGYLVEGSQNVLSNISERISARKGYTIDGQENTSITDGGIVGSFTWKNHLGYERVLRWWDDKIEYRYNVNGTIEWRTLVSGLSSVQINSDLFWDETDLEDRWMFVNGDSNIRWWNGAVAEVASNTATTITKSGSSTWANEGFNTTGSFVYNGTTYAYTGGSGTTTLTGVTPALPTITVGEPVSSSIESIANSSTTGLPAAFHNDLICISKNQIYLGSFVERNIYISKVSSYTDWSFATPRVVGEGALLTLDATPVAMVVQEDVVHISAGEDYWYKVKFTLSSDNANEALNIEPLKFARKQGAVSQAFVTKIKNKVAVLTNEVSFDLLGRVENITATQELEDISDSIRVEVDNTDFTGGSAAYHRNFIYLSAPAQSKVLIYNMEKKFWEAPQILPVGSFQIIGGELYGHDPNIPQTYKLFNGNTDNGNPIDSRAVFSYQSFGDRENRKSFNVFYVEGYIAMSTTITAILRYDYEGCKGLVQLPIKATNMSMVCQAGTDTNSLGKKSLGQYSIGGNTEIIAATSLPKFRYHKQMAKKDFFEIQVEFRSNEIGYEWELLAYGFAVSLSTSDPVFNMS